MNQLQLLELIIALYIDANMGAHLTRCIWPTGDMTILFQPLRNRLHSAANEAQTLLHHGRYTKLYGLAIPPIKQRYSMEASTHGLIWARIHSKLTTLLCVRAGIGFLPSHRAHVLYFCTWLLTKTDKIRTIEEPVCGVPVVPQPTVETLATRATFLCLLCTAEATFRPLYLLLLTPHSTRYKH